MKIEARIVVKGWWPQPATWCRLAMSDGTYGYVKRKSIRRIKDGGAKDESIMKLPGEETRFRDSCDRVGRGEEHVEEGMYDEDP